MNPLSIRCYAPPIIYENYIPYIKKILTKYAQLFTLLPSIKTENHMHIIPNDISILIMREVEVKFQNTWFMTHISEVVKHTNKKILIIVFSALDKNITNKRKIDYQLQVPNATIHYLNFEDWFPMNTDDIFNKHYKQLPLLDDIIINFITSIMSDMYMY